MEISLKLNKDFERTLESLRTKYSEDFEYINGVHPSQLDYTEFLANFIQNSTLADATIDPNANASHRDIRSFMTEKGKSEDKLFGLNKIFIEMKKMWGIRTAKQWLEQEYTKGFYLNDSATSSFYPYCWANDLTRLATEGLFFLKNYNNQAPKHLTTYFDDVIEFTSFLSNRQSGAVGLPNVIIWAYYFWKKDVAEGKCMGNPDYYLKQNFQKFIFRLNQPFMRIDQCAFTNVSIFDRCYLESLFGGMEFPDGSFAIDQIEEIIDCQKKFMEVVSDIRSEQMFTFPVLTYSLYYKDGRFQDEDFARWCSNHNMKWNDSNFFISDNIGILSNCCFDANQEFYYLDSEGNKILTTFKDFVESRLTKNYNGSQVTNEISDEYIIDPNTGEKAEIKAVSKLPNKSGKLIEIELENGQILRVTPDQKIFDKKSQKLVEACKILENPEAYDIPRIKRATEILSNDPVYDIEVNTQDHTFMIEDVRVENCRLLSDTNKLDAFINSIGGTSLSVGSCRVSTINLVRIAYESKYNKKKYLDILKERTELDCKALTAMRHIIARNIEKGLLPNYDEGALELDKQFCTIGGIGMYEVMDLFGLINTDEFGNKSYSDEAVGFTTDILNTLNEVKDNFDCDFSFNLEMIPAENCAGVICTADNLLFEQDKYYIYSNQWVPLKEKCTIQEKCRLGSLFDKLCGGGCIAHINIENRFATKDEAWDMLNYVASHGVMYSAFNCKISVCPSKHSFIGTRTCPICGEEVVDQYTRVVGFFTPVSSYQKIRKREFNERKWYNVLDKDTMF